MLKEKIKNSKFIGVFATIVYRKIKVICKIPKDIKLYKETKKALEDSKEQKRIIYIGVPAHGNLGDLAQGICIRKWIKKHFSDRQIVEIETNALVNTTRSALKILKKEYNEEDIIIFQSGYTTTDLGGYADEMHCAVINALPSAKMIMMPQTIYFQSDARKENTSQTYDKAKNMLFLARDAVSFEMAKEMFKKISLLLYPDIVTTMIGQFEFSNKRDGIMVCCRDDSEKFYSDEEIDSLINKCSEFTNVNKTDTTKRNKKNDIVINAEKHIMAEIEEYSKYKLVITDRYHGTIFSLIAGTPVIIIKTTDHKVTTGADWFKGVYDSHVMVAQTLDEAFEKAKEIYQKNPACRLPKYFEQEYYDKLPDKFSQIVEKNSEVQL